MTQQKLKCLRRSALAALITAALSQNMAYADLSVGSIFGQTEKGVTISVKNLQTGLKRELTSDNSGRFNFSQLPSGRYQVVANGVTREVNVAIGTGTPVNFSEETTERIAVVGSTISPIDTSSVESSTVFTAAQMERLPVGRDISDVALLAPGTVRGDSGFGKLASFGGSSVAENGYYINGFDVTNARTFLSYGRVPFDAIGEQEVKPVVLVLNMAAP
ncbi:carboxypeptidase regulatory-like domain-containing protein [Rheinheimera sp. KL1]|uniref:carboxypeptidase-like regulatory domain-containing protein n=1 Tax=Rheinheimera sp. KL1 TaxID=1635005 RepID=UPI0006A945D7|nr:carboxypeptidase regulatory-like domain-containing protein [Rheinheimera sp. KL1]